MIPGSWKDPNLSFEGTDADGHEEKHVIYAGSEDELRTWLKSLGLKDVSISPYDFNDVKGWKDRADKLTEKLKNAGSAAERSKIYKSSPIWKELKWHLFALFDFKCAYCEWNPQGGSWGDVEHYRPKREVSEDSTHPGYYWLAYDESNLLPACQLCNQARGKETHFPVQEGTRVFEPGPVISEKAMLLNPYQLDAEPHLRFVTNEEPDAVVGQVVGVSEDGETSVMTYHLNRPFLVIKRADAIDNVKKDLDIKILSLGGGLAVAAALEELKTELLQGRGEFAAARLAELNGLVEHLFDKIRQVLN